MLTVYGSFFPPGLGRCRGDFNPKQALNEFKEGASSGIQLEEVACMKMCKRGPNVRMVCSSRCCFFMEHRVMNGFLDPAADLRSIVWPHRS